MASPRADPAVLRQAVLSGRARDGQQLGCANLLGNRLTIGLQASDVDLDRLGPSLPALVDRAAAGEASGQSRNRHEVAAAILGRHDNCVGAHRTHLVTARTNP
jgi:hypothetical protein